MIKKVLIANRGEIAVRIIRACQELGVATVAVYSTADKDAMHVALATEAVCIGGPRSSESYLNKVNILSAALSTGADAIHPGFGFLAENSEFARMCEELGIKFIGPSPDIIDLMGNKANARRAMIEAQVPVIPGSNHFIQSTEELLEVAETLGYPLILKAVAGGGGKGMRKVYQAEELIPAFQTAQAEAKAAFDDGRMYVEKIIQPAKHIEFQMLADEHGNVIHLGERDCSMQRNHQKVLEETPATLLSETLRQQMGEATVRAAQAIGYQNAGTIEFLVDEQQQFYFMEMNTRIQVEHPVTEMATDIDLVKWQIKIASGEPLTITQNDVHLSGHTIECRINAENPFENFLPSSGQLSYLHFPGGGNGLRIESAMFPEYVIPPFYDSMVAKIITKGHTREEAIAKMKRALGELVIEGVTTNVEFQEALLEAQEFIDGTYDTDFIQHRFLPQFFEQHA